MRLEQGLADRPVRREGAPAWVTIGNFDGVHRGHRRILERILTEARQAGGEAAVVTFSPHPRCVLRPDDCPPELTTLSEKAWLLEEAGVDRLVVVPFDLEVSRWPAEHFCRRLLGSFRLRRLVVGHDFALGHRRQGDIAFLRRWGGEAGVEVEAVDPLADDGGPISSSRVRAALEAGEMAEVARLLGSPFFVEGTLERTGQPAGTDGAAGVGRAAVLPVPGGKALPGPGVYACRLDLDGSPEVTAGVVAPRDDPRRPGAIHLRAHAGASRAAVRCEVVARLGDAADPGGPPAAEAVERARRALQEIVQPGSGGRAATG